MTKFNKKFTEFRVVPELASSWPCQEFSLLLQIYNILKTDRNLIPIVDE